MEQFIINNAWLTIPIALWTLPWVGIALWKAARRGDNRWFITLLMTNTLGILEILYIFVFSKEKKNPISKDEDI